MEIVETTSQADNKEHILSYTYTRLPFNGFTKEVQNKFFLWGLDKSLMFIPFRFNISFNDLNSPAFFTDLFNSKEFRESLKQVSLDNLISEVKFEKLKCTHVNFNILDKFEELGTYPNNNCRTAL